MPEVEPLAVRLFMRKNTANPAIAATATSVQITIAAMIPPDIPSLELLLTTMTVLDAGDTGDTSLREAATAMMAVDIDAVSVGEALDTAL